MNIKYIRINPLYRDLLPPQAAHERMALIESIKTEGIREPLILRRDGVLLDGHNRYAVALSLGIEDVPTTYLEGVEDPLAWIVQNQCARRNWSNDQQASFLALIGVDVPAGDPRRAAYRMAKKLLDAGRDDLVKECRDNAAVSLRSKYNQHFGVKRTRITKKSAAPQGPQSNPYVIPDGHELKGRSTLTGPNGEVRGAWDKTGIAPTEPLFDPLPEGHHIVSQSTSIRGDGTVSMQHIRVQRDVVDRERMFREAWLAFAQENVEPAPAVARPLAHVKDILTVYPLGDPHIGLLAHHDETGDNHDTKIGARELVATVTALVQAAPASETAIICNLGDFFHAQDNAQKTPGHGHKLDVDSRAHKVLQAGIAALIACVDACLAKHKKVIVRNLPGNHDPNVAVMLEIVLRQRYLNEPRVSVQSAAAKHQFDEFGQVLLGWTHGDSTLNPSELHGVMSTDQVEAWGRTTERYYHVGHIHHKSMKEHYGLVVESHRTMAGGDAWHRGKYRAGRSLNAITYHREYGEVARSTVNLAMIRNS